ncbi:MAG: hypothetical protein PF692_09400 [Kiritimatiellae bacterium]|jgi:hypothetical protein|nr:hypothetical protein [Kiritimatiellia bacterium]
MNEQDNPVEHNDDYVEKLNKEGSHELSPVEMVLEREKIILEREKLSYEREMLEFERTKWQSSQGDPRKSCPKSMVFLGVGFFSLLFLVFGVVFGYIIKDDAPKDSFLSSALIQRLSNTNILNRELLSDELGDAKTSGSTYLLIVK